ncbi:MAG: hypothetical protein RIR70_1091, partial [Pseudomonadota bacterium]
MTQPWSGQAAAEAQGFCAWRLPSEVGQSLEAVAPEGALEVAPQAAQVPAGAASFPEPAVPAPGAATGLDAAPIATTVPASRSSYFAPESMGPDGWNRDDYQSYLKLTGGLAGGASQSAEIRLPQAGGQALAVTSDSEESQRLVQQSIEALNRVWSQFPSETMSRSDLRAFLAESRIPNDDRTTISRLIDDDQAFSLLDRLGGTISDGRIAQSTVALYAVGEPQPDKTAAPVGKDARQSSAQSGEGQEAGAEDALASDAESQGETERGSSGKDSDTKKSAAGAEFAPAVSAEGAATTNGSADVAAEQGHAPALEEILSRNFTLLDQAAKGSTVDQVITRDDLTTASQSSILEANTRDALSFVTRNPDQFDSLDKLDGKQDGRITWDGLREASKAAPAPEAGGEGLNPDAELPPSPNPGGGDYTPIFFSAVQDLAGEEGLALFSESGKLDVSAMRNSSNETLRELSNDPIAFKQLDMLDGAADGSITRQGIIEATQPSSLLFEAKVKDENGNEIGVMQKVYSDLAKKYEDFDLPQPPDGVNNDQDRAYRAVLALSDNLAAVLGEKLKDAASGGALSISVEDLQKAATDENIIGEDRIMLEEVANDTALFDWLCGVGEGGGGVSSIPVERLAELVSDWNRANFDDLRYAYGMLNHGLEDLARGQDEVRGFKQGMTQEEVSAKLFDPAALAKAYNRMMADPSIQADITQLLGETLPDAKDTARKMGQRLESGFFAGYVDWLGSKTNSQEASQLVGSEVSALKMLDAELGGRVGDSLASQLLFKQAQAMGAQADETLAKDLLKLILTQLPTTGLRESRTGFRLAGNVLSALEDIVRIPNELNKLVDALLPKMLRPWDPAVDTPSPKSPGNPAEAAPKEPAFPEALSKSGVLGTIATGFGVVLGAITIAGHANDGKPNTLQDRLTDALVVLAPMSYGNQVAKSVNYILLNVFKRDDLANFTKLAGRPLSDLVRLDKPTLQAQIAEDATMPPTEIGGARAAAIMTRALVAGLDIGGGAVAAALGSMQISHAKETGDKVDLASGALLTAGGGLWLLGGVASVATVGLAAPFYVLSGVTALAGLVTGWFKDPSKDFAQKFGSQFASLEAAGVMRSGWREFSSDWFNSNYEDLSGQGGLGL